MEDEKVKKQLARERIEQATTDFENTEDNNWQEKLSINKNGQIKDDLQNLVLIMQNDENLKDIAYNQHRDGVDCKGSLPWKQVKNGWNDCDMSALKVYFDKTYGVWSPTKTKEALIAVAAERAYHPIKEYLESLPEWDGIERLDTLLIDYLGAEDNGYSKAVIRKTLVAAVARIYEPGTKFDSVLILNGPQGIGKSTFFSKLGGKYTIQRSKGLGENNPDMMWETTMNPDTRRLVQITPDDMEKTEMMFDLLLGDNLPGRKSFIEENGYKYLDMIDVS
jgi:predicted P-loop ATPase